MIAPLTNESENLNYCDWLERQAAFELLVEARIASGMSPKDAAEQVTEEIKARSIETMNGSRKLHYQLMQRTYHPYFWPLLEEKSGSFLKVIEY